MTEFSSPFNLTFEYVDREVAMLEEMAREQPMLADIARQRIAELKSNPNAYYDERLVEEVRTIDMSAKIMRAAGLDLESDI